MKRKYLIVICLLICLAVTSTCFAYSLFEGGYDSKNICMNTSYYVDSAYSTAVSNAIGNWGYLSYAYISGSCSSTTGVSENIVYTGEYGDDWYGRYCGYSVANPPDEDHQSAYFKIYLNEDELDAEGTNFKRSTMAHEIGHAFGLNDLSSGTSIMNWNRDRDTLYTVQSDDVSGMEDSWD